MTKDAQFLQAVGHVIKAQVQLAVAPLLKKIEEQEEELTQHKLKIEELVQKKFERSSSMIDEAVLTAMAALPPMRDGKDGAPGIDGKDGVPGKDGKDGLNGEQGPAGKDGVDVTDLLINRDGELIATLSNGTTKKVGHVVGEDGTPGLDGKDGERGKDGLDGVGFDDLRVEYDGERKLEFIFIKGENEKRFTFKLPVPLDRGVWKPGDFEKGDGVSHGGSWWIAQIDTSGKPELTKEWRLAVKRGDRGKDGVDGKRGDVGPRGSDGRDLTQLGPDGSKWA